jgi:hypothetical protein
VLEKVTHFTPRYAPNKDIKKVTEPIIIAGSRMDDFRNAKLIPTIRASILVATASARSTE